MNFDLQDHKCKSYNSRTFPDIYKKILAASLKICASYSPNDFWSTQSSWPLRRKIRFYNFNNNPKTFIAQTFLIYCMAWLNLSEFETFNFRCSTLRAGLSTLFKSNSKNSPVILYLALLSSLWPDSQLLHLQLSTKKVKSF